MLRRILLTVAALTLILPATDAVAGELRGSLASMRRQYRAAKRNDYTFLRTAREVREWVRKERLVTVRSGRHYVLADVSFPYVRPPVKLFLDRFAAQYHAATGDRLVITSLTRPVNMQPENASALSVHPAGMAIDLRIPRSARNRRWIERVLLSLEDKVVLDVTRERHPAHYHVAVFPARYEEYVERRSEE